MGGEGWRGRDDGEDEGERVGSCSTVNTDSFSVEAESKCRGTCVSSGRAAFHSSQDTTHTV